MHTPKTICLRCGLECDIARIGVRVITLAFEPPQPYRIQSADVVRCPGCGIEVVDASRYADRAIEHFEGERFQQELAAAEATPDRTIRVHEHVRQSAGAQQARQDARLVEELRIYAGGLRAAARVLAPPAAWQHDRQDLLRLWGALERQAAPTLQLAVAPAEAVT